MILPVPGPAFAWVETEQGPLLVCRAIDGVAVHGFTTRHWLLGARPAAGAGHPGWADVAAAVGVEPAHLLRVRQVHGRAVAIEPGPPDLPPADIVLAGHENLAPAVQTADCVPLLLADPVRGAVAAVHAGWRGLALRAPEAAVAALAAAFGSRPVDLLAACGPSVGACCYEVGADVRDRFVEAGFGGELVKRWFLERPAVIPGNPALPGLAGEPRTGRWFFDGWAAVRDELRQAGVLPERTFSAGLCTASHPAVFCSFRRDGAAAGRMAAAIRIAAPPRPSPGSPAGRRARSTRAARARS